LSTFTFSHELGTFHLRHEHGYQTLPSRTASTKHSPSWLVKHHVAHRGVAEDAE